MVTWTRIYKGRYLDQYALYNQTKDYKYSYVIFHTGKYITGYSVYSNHTCKLEYKCPRPLTIEHTDLNIQKICDNLNKDLLIIQI